MSAPSRQPSPAPNVLPTNSSAAPPSTAIENIVAGLLSSPAFNQLLSSAIAQSSSVLHSPASVSVNSDSHSTAFDDKKSSHLHGQHNHDSEDIAQESSPGLNILHSKNSSKSVTPSKASSPSPSSDKHPNSTMSIQVNIDQDITKHPLADEVAIPSPHFDDSIKGSNTCHNSSDLLSVPLQSHSAHWDGKISSTIGSQWNPFDFPTPRVASDTRCELEAKDRSTSGASSMAHVLESTICNSSGVALDNRDDPEHKQHHSTSEVLSNALVPHSSTSKPSRVASENSSNLRANHHSSSDRLSRAHPSHSIYNSSIHDGAHQHDTITIPSSGDDDSELDDPTYTLDSDDDNSFLSVDSDLNKDSFEHTDGGSAKVIAWQHSKTSSDDSSTAADMQSESIFFFTFVKNGAFMFIL